MKTDESTENKKVVIYQVMARLFGNKTTKNIRYGTREENGVGKFNDFTVEALKGIKELGITHIWFTGVLEHAVIEDYSQYGIAIDDADVVKGRAGSPYAIKDYYDVNPDLANNIPDRLTEFKNLIRRTHKSGMKVIIDFVPNHVARKYVSDAKPEGVVDFGVNDDYTKSFSPQNNFYYIIDKSFQVPEDYEPIPGYDFPTKDSRFEETPAKATGNDKFDAAPSQYDWFETVKLNYGVDYQNDRQKYFNPIPDTWKKMRDILSYWANFGVDGFRCDMAEMVPVEFWAWVIPQIQELNPDIIFIAEIYNPQQYENYINRGKFNYLYDKVELYDTLRQVIEGHGSTNNISPIIHDFRVKGIGDQMLRFMENHDEQRLASRFFAGDPLAGWPATALSATISNGPMMIYFGQEVGEPGLGEEGFQGDDGRTTIFDYWGVPEHQKWMNDGKFDGGRLSPEQRDLRELHARLLNICNQNDALREGELIDIHGFNLEDASGYKNDKVFTFMKTIMDQYVLVACNFGEATNMEIILPKQFHDIKWSNSLELLSNDAFDFKNITNDKLAFHLDKNKVVIIEPDPDVIK